MIEYIEEQKNPVCLMCRHFLGDKGCCTAFEQIPLEILRGEHDHTKPYPGDHGIRFEPIEDKKADE